MKSIEEELAGVVRTAQHLGSRIRDLVSEQKRQEARLTEATIKMGILDALVSGAEYDNPAIRGICTECSGDWIAGLCECDDG